MSKKYISPEEQIAKKRESRALSKDRPTSKGDCRIGMPMVCDKTPEHPFLRHEFVFLRDDRYGVCKRCGCEILT